MEQSSDKTPQLSKKRKLLMYAVTFGISILLFLIISEVILRVIPIPGIEYNYAKYDEITGYGFHPNSTNIYRNDRGDVVHREINQWGYFDKEYTQQKDPGTFRIGFFGDSYTQAVQVPLKNTFHYLIEETLDNNTQTLSFGVSGYSTYQSYLNSQRWSPFFDLDLVVYVLCENDLGDQIKSLKKSDATPYPILQGDSIVPDNSFREKFAYKKKFYYRSVDFLNSNFLVFATISNRVKLLLKYGVKTKVTEKDRLMGADDKNKDEPLRQTDNPSFWPDSLKSQAMLLESKILANWQNELAERNTSFAILYVPRASEIEKETDQQDAWKPWILEYCHQKDIPVIDPSARLLSRMSKGEEVYYDHFTAEGHAALSESFITWFQNSHSSFAPSNKQP